MQPPITLRLETDYIRFDCGKCGHGEELKVQYLGHLQTAVPHFRFSCEKCGYLDERKGDGIQWQGLPFEAE